MKLSTVFIIQVLKNLLERLADYASSSPEVVKVYEEQNVFASLLDLIKEAVVIYLELTAETSVDLFASLLQFNMRVFKDKLDQADSILESCSKVCSLSTFRTYWEKRAFCSSVPTMRAP